MQPAGSSFHRSTKQCGKDGLKFREILRRYLSPRLEIVAVAGTTSSAASTAMQQPSSRTMPASSGERLDSRRITTRARVVCRHQAGRARTSWGIAQRCHADGKDDLVWLKKTGTRTGRLRVALSDGVDYGAGQTWFDGNLTVPLAGARLAHR